MRCRKVAAWWRPAASTWRRRNPFGALLATALAAASLIPSVPAAAAEPPTKPILRIEPGMHTAMVNRMAVVGGAILATASDDKTVRLWDLADGRSRGILRPPIGADDEGALYAVASDGATIATGGRTCRSWDPEGYCVYLFSADQQRMLGRIGGLRAPVMALAFSPDGRYLAVGMQGQGGVRVLDMKARGLAFDDPGFTDTVSWLAFDSQNRLAAVSADGGVRLFAPGGGAVAQAKVDGAWSAAFSPDGRTLAVGTVNAGVTLLDGRSATVTKRLDGDAGKSSGLSVVAWSPDGGTLYAGGRYGNAAGWAVRSWQAPSFAQGVDQRVASTTVTDLAGLGAGRLAFASALPEWGVVDKGGRIAFGQTSQTIAFPKGRGDWLKVSADGQVVDLLDTGLRFDLGRRTLGPLPAGIAAGLEPPTGAVSDWKNSTTPRVANKAVALEPNELARAAAADGGFAVLGSDFYVRAFDGGQPLWKVVAPAPVRAVAATADKSKVVAALADGSLRWYRRSDGQEVLAVAIHPSDRRWVAWTPDGYFDHNARSDEAGRGDELIGYHLNRARNREAEFVRLEQLYTRFARRDVLMDTFRGKPAPKTQEVAEAVLQSGLPPKIDGVELCSDGCRATVRGLGIAADTSRPEAEITVRLTDRGGGIGKSRVLRNGVLVDGNPAVVESGKDFRVEKHKVALQPGANHVIVSAFDSKGVVEAKEEDRTVVDVRYAQATEKSLQKAKLYVLAVGINDYAKLPKLDNAAGDATAIADALAAGRLDEFDKVDTVRLTNQQASGAGIRKAFAELAEKTKPEDAFIVFFAGHGHAINGQYYFAPADVGAGAAKFSKDNLVKEGISQDEFSAALAKVKAARGLVMLDTCFSSSLALNEVNTTAASQLGNAARRPILAAAGAEALDGSVLANQGKDGQHGVFTTYLLAGLKGAADLNRNQRVDILELALYVMDAVKEDAAMQDFVQEPTFSSQALHKFDVADIRRLK